MAIDCHPHKQERGYNYSSFKNSSGDKCKVSGPGAFFEYRYVTSFGLDLGTQINWKYGLRPDSYEEEEQTYDSKYNNVCLKALCDYTFLRQGVVNPFVGFSF